MVDAFPVTRHRHCRTSIGHLALGRKSRPHLCVCCRALHGDVLGREILSSPACRPAQAKSRCVHDWRRAVGAGLFFLAHHGQHRQRVLGQRFLSNHPCRGAWSRRWSCLLPTRHRLLWRNEVHHAVVDSAFPRCTWLSRVHLRYTTIPHK